MLCSSALGRDWKMRRRDLPFGRAGRKEKSRFIILSSLPGRGGGKERGEALFSDWIFRKRGRQSCVDRQRKRTDESSWEGSR